MSYKKMLHDKIESNRVLYEEMLLSPEMKGWTITFDEKTGEIGVKKGVK